MKVTSGHTGNRGQTNVTAVGMLFVLRNCRCHTLKLGLSAGCHRLDG